MGEQRTVDISPLLDADEFGKSRAKRELVDAIEAASDQGKITWLVDRNGKRIAAVVPVDVAEEHERQIEAVLATAAGPSRVILAAQCLEVPHERHTLATGEECAGWPPDHRPVNQWVEAPNCRLLGHAQHELKGIIYSPSYAGDLNAPGTPPHAHWVGDRAQGHEEFMRLSGTMGGKHR